MEFEKQLIIAIVVLTGLSIGGVVIEAKAWHAFAEEHHCKVVSHISGESFTAVNTSGGVSVGSTSPKTGYLCDDGITYVR